ncbi:protein RNA-directed DNA methylation 3 isoform X2 [Vigna angularis]|uniref:protein RNA-directed DNA methylation 3 isoform X2 n=1 Tax=Phaseolus angularis TaxID=3914 RepID=UPI0022B394BF|nr:protein RNA-directed DNA methylation 3 isoform X2 [Vigna angularis]
MTNKGKGKGKEVAGKASTGKRKASFDDDKTGGRFKSAAMKFIDDAADVDDSDDSDDSDLSEESDFGDDSSDEAFDSSPRRMSEPGPSNFPRVPKEELVDEEEFDRILEERYADPSRFIKFADEFDDKGNNSYSIHDAVMELMPNIWKVKCTVGRERLSALCLMQKFADLFSLGTVLKIKSAFAVDHMKGFVYIEAERQCDINEACQGIPGIYVTRVALVPNSEVYHLFSVRNRTPEISEGMWARIKGGNYKGDLAQVVAVNNTRKKVTVKLIPRIDLQALAAKFGGGYSRQKVAVPAPRLISSSELEEFRPLIQVKRDRETGKVFEVLDGLMLKDGYVYKKVSPDSLSLWGVVPTEEELLKFGTCENNESKDLEWLAQLYGGKKKKRVIRPNKGGGKGESSSDLGVGNDFELYDLVCFGKKDFGVIVGMDKDDIYRGKQGIVKHIYRGIVFLHDGNEEENGGYVTCKSNMCEKVKLDAGDFSGKDSEPGPLFFEDQPSSPRSPLSPKKPWQARENNREFNRGDSNNMFNIGQTLRIRIGPLKGYLCRVIALRRADVTVKLDSQQKVLTVKCEHLSEVQGKSAAISSRGDPDSSSSKPFELLGGEGSSGGWLNGVGTSTGSGGWNAAGASSERGTWSNDSAPSLLKPDSSLNPFSSKGAEDSPWETKSNSNQNSPWVAAVEKTGVASNPENSGGCWGNGGGSWGLAERKTGSVGDDNQNSNWNTTKISEKESSGWNSVQKSNETSLTGWGDGNGFKSGSDEGNLTSNWRGWESGTSGVKVGNPSGSSDINASKDAGWSNKPNKEGSEPSGMGTKSNWNASGYSSRDVEEEGKDQGGWSAGNTSDGPAVGFGQAENSGSDLGKDSKWNAVSDGTGANQGNGWGQKSNWNSGSWNDSNEKKSTSGNSHWSSGRTEPGNQDSNLDMKSNWNSGSSGNWASDSKNSNCNPGSDNSNENPDRGNNDNWNSNKRFSSAGNESKNSSWSSRHPDTGINDSSWGNKSNWNSGSGDANQNNSWKNNSSWSAGSSDKQLNSENEGSNENSRGVGGGNWRGWNSGSGDANQNNTWKSNSSWSAGSSDNQLNGENEGSNENSRGAGGGNWRGGYQGRGGSDRGGFRGRGFRGRGDRGGFGGRGDRGGFGGRGDRGGFGGRGDRGGFGGRGDRGGFGGRGDRGGGDRGGFGGRGDRGGGDRGGFGGRGRSDKEGFGGRWGSGGGRGRGRSDQSGSWNNRRDSSEDGSSDWKKGPGNVEGWSNSNGSQASNQDTGDKKKKSWSQENADKEHPSWNRGGGSEERWSSASGGANDNRSQAWKHDTGDKDRQSWSQGNADKESPSWNQGGGNKPKWSSADGGANDSGWNQGGGSKKSWSSVSGEANDNVSQAWNQVNADKDRSGWNQGGNKQSWSSASGANDNWNSNESRQATCASLKKSTAEETNVQDGGWNKGSSSNTTGVLKWGQSSSAADNGQSSSWKESAEGAAGSWGKKNDGVVKGGW